MEASKLLAEEPRGCTGSHSYSFALAVYTGLPPMEAQLQRLALVASQMSACWWNHMQGPRNVAPNTSGLKEERESSTLLYLQCSTAGDGVEEAEQCTGSGPEQAAQGAGAD